MSKIAIEQKWRQLSEAAKNEAERYPTAKRARRWSERPVNFIRHRK